MNCLPLSIWRFAALGVFVAVLTACGGGGGGGGSSPAPTENPSVIDTPNAYLPTGANVRLTYGAAGQLRFSQDVVENGVHVHSLLYPTGGIEYFVTTADSIQLRGLYLPRITAGGETYTGDIRFDNFANIFRNDHGAGFTQPLDGAGTIDVQPHYGKKALTYSGSASDLGEEVVATALGNLRARRIVIDLSLNTVVEGTAFAVPYRVTFWLAKGVGIVQRSQDGTVYLLSSVEGVDISAALDDGTGTTNTIEVDSTGLSFILPADASSTRFVWDTFTGDIDAVGITPGYNIPPWLSVAPAGYSSGKTQYSVTVDSHGLAMGQYSTSLRFRTGSLPNGESTIDQATSVDFVDLPVELIVDDFSISAQSMSLSAPEHGSLREDANARALSLVTAAGWTATTDQSWLSVDQPAGSGSATLHVQASPASLPAGTYSGHIFVTNAASGEVLILPVTLVVEIPQLTLSTQTLSYAVGALTTSGQLAKTLSISDELGGIDVAHAATWHVQSTDVDWIASISPSSGSSAPSTSVVVALDAAKLAALPNGARTGHVSIAYTTYNGQSHTATLAVPLDLALPRVRFVGPSVVYVGQQFEVVLRGSGFLGTSAQSVLFDGVAAASATVVSDTEIHATYPALSAGARPVSVANQLGYTLDTAHLFVQGTGALPAMTVASSGVKSKAFFDERRQVLYGVDRNAGHLERWALQSGNWTALPSIAVPNLQDAAISTSGDTLVAVTDGFGVYELDLTDANATIQSTALSPLYMTQIAFTNHNLAVIGTSYHGSGMEPTFIYNADDKSIRSPTVTMSGTSFFDFYLCLRMGPSADGRRIMMAEGCLSPVQPMSVFDASSDVLHGLPLQSPHVLSTSRDGSKFLTGNGGGLYNASLQWLGSACCYISPDGTRAYAYDVDNYNNTLKMSVYDLTGTPGGDTYFPQLTPLTISSALVASMVYWSAPATVVSGDGHTLFMWGNNQLQILPLP
jgi:hypothetical protein